MRLRATNAPFVLSRALYTSPEAPLPIFSRMLWDQRDAYIFADVSWLTHSKCCLHQLFKFNLTFFYWVLIIILLLVAEEAPLLERSALSVYSSSAAALIRVRIKRVSVLALWTAFLLNFSSLLVLLENYVRKSLCSGPAPFLESCLSLQE